MYGAGDGTGQRFRCPACHWRTEAASLRAELDRLRAERDEGSARLANALSLKIPPGFDPITALELDIRRLLDVDRMWSEACAIARVHCPVGDGESHIQQGIPALAKRAEAAEERARALEARLKETARCLVTLTAMGNEEAIDMLTQIRALLSPQPETKETKP